VPGRLSLIRRQARDGPLVWGLISLQCAHSTQLNFATAEFEFQMFAIFVYRAIKIFHRRGTRYSPNYSNWTHLVTSSSPVGIIILHNHTCRTRAGTADSNPDYSNHLDTRTLALCGAGARGSQANTAAVELLLHRTIKHSRTLTSSHLTSSLHHRKSHPRGERRA
jgi:hypothetical protein